MTEARPYYNHDHIWRLRQELNQPIWGSYSRHLYRRIVEDFASPFFVPGDSLLDIGCGAGAFGCFVLERKLKYVGVDESRVAIELGKQSFPTLELYRADFALSEVLVSGYATGHFDIVCLINVLHCLPQAEERNNVLRHAASFLKPGGKLILTNMVGPVLQEGFREAKAPRIYLSRESLLSEIESVGFRQRLAERHQPQSKTAPIPNIEWVFST